MSASPGWECREPIDSTDVHVLPVNDLIDHPPVDCPCMPSTAPVPRDDGSMGWVVTHHSLDGRELHEPDYQGARPSKS